jgi:hypothetical protein
VVLVGYGPDGRPRRRTVSARTRTEVVAKLQALQRQVDDGLPPPDAGLTLAQLLARWHVDVLRHQVSVSTAANYKSVFDHHLVPALGRKKVVALTPADVDALLSAKLETGLSISTVRRIRAVLSQALDQGLRWGVVNRNVAALTRGPKARRREGRMPTPEDARRLFAALSGHRNEALYTLMLAPGRGVPGTPGPPGGRAPLARRGRAGQRLRVHHLPRHARRPAQLLPGVPGDLRGRRARALAPPRAPPLGRQPHARTGRKAAGRERAARHQHSSIRMTADVYGHVLAPDRKAAAEAMSEVLWGSRGT